MRSERQSLQAIRFDVGGWRCPRQESGVGNASILLMNRLADALALPLSEILVRADAARPDLNLAVQLLSRLNDADLQESLQWLHD